MVTLFVCLYAIWAVLAHDRSIKNGMVADFQQLHQSN